MVIPVGSRRIGVEVRTGVGNDDDAGGRQLVQPAALGDLAEDAARRVHGELHAERIGRLGHERTEATELADRKVRGPDARRRRSAHPGRSSGSPAPTGGPLTSTRTRSGSRSGADGGLQGRRLRGQSDGVEHRDRTGRGGTGAECLERILARVGRQPDDRGDATGRPAGRRGCRALRRLTPPPTSPRYRDRGHDQASQPRLRPVQPGSGTQPATAAATSEKSPYLARSCPEDGVHEDDRVGLGPGDVLAEARPVRLPGTAHRSWSAGSRAAR